MTPDELRELAYQIDEERWTDIRFSARYWIDKLVALAKSLEESK